ncbi:MAG: ABC transporter ATP-binding protein [Anaerolineae bacterium]|nr:ABC transporter ATP-binding protein [Anaerolineae bacterium]
MNKVMFRTLIRICKRYWMALLAFLVGGISQTVIGLCAITLFQRLLDGVVGAQQFSDVSGTFAWYVGLSLANHLLIYLEGFPRSILYNGSYMWAKLQAMKKVSRIDYLAYQDLGTGELVQVIENGATATRSILNDFYLSILRGIIPQLVVSFAMIRYYDRTLFLIILGLYVLLFLLSLRLMIALRQEREKLIASQEQLTKFSVRGFMEMLVFRINGRFRHEIERIQGISGSVIRSRARIYGVQELFFTGFAVLVFLLQAGVVVQQGVKIVAGLSTVGTLVALVQFIGIVTGPISHFSVAFVNYRLESVAFRRFARFLSLPEDAGLAKGAAIQIERGTISFQNASFAYGERSVVRNLTLTLDGGQTTALVGSSGSGKSTMVELVLHLLKPEQGRVLVDGQDLADVNLESFYTQVAYIPQEPPIFDGTIRENLCFDEQIQEGKIQRIVEQVGLDKFVAALPDGLETLVGERGIKLSGGERQRLAFGRVLVQDPRVVIMDEPTSSLDSVTERFVTDSMKTFFEGRTVLVVAHRLQTVRYAQQIVVLEGGEIVEEGTFESLMARNGHFRLLWDEQTREAHDAGSRN